MVNGWCFGGAYGPLFACDLAFASDDAQFGLSEINGNFTRWWSYKKLLLNY